ncbi:MAG TPA: hypothetical protein VMW16_16575 [Sedimentisphaerales bacterium]|nr:hypothetical protein [Sedimentisphaerales bacterium]
MKQENRNIEELLNGYIDDELTDRHRAEVERMISTDSQIARRLRQLHKCKMLVGALPHAEAPTETLELVKASLQRQVLVGRQRSPLDERQGARHLLLRRVVSVAAMIGLVAVLGAVVYTILAPPTGTEMTTMVQGPSEGQEDVAKVDAPGKAIPAFYGRLQLKTASLVAVDAKINRAIENSGLAGSVGLASEANRIVYTLTCSRESLRALLTDLEGVWNRFDAASLFVETDRFGEPVVVDAVTAGQIGEIVNSESAEARIGAAKDFAVSNKIAGLLPGKQVLTALGDRIGDSITIPRPVLTAAEKPTKKPPAKPEDKQQVHLTIVLTGGK